MIFIFGWRKAVEKLDAEWNRVCLGISRAERIDTSKESVNHYEKIYDLIHRVHSLNEKSKALYKEIMTI